MSNDVDWKLARSVAGRVSNPDPRFAEPHIRNGLESDLLELTSQAEELVEAETGLVSLAGPARARVTDRLGWVDANLASFDRLVRPLLHRLREEQSNNGDGSDREPGLVDRFGSTLTETVPFGRRLAPVVGPAVRGLGSTVGGAVNDASEFLSPKVAGLEVGALLGWMSGRVLGQYDLLIIEDERPEDQDWVYYVGPNILMLEERYAFPPREFRLWIAVHECTHRAQFTGVPWLRSYFLSLVNELLDSVDPDPKHLLETVRGVIENRRNGDGPALADGGLSLLFATPEQRRTLDKVSGLMSLLEGHGDITMDRAATDLVPSQARFHKVMSQRRKNATGLSKLIQRLTGLEAKLAQYEEGENFVTTVEQAGGRSLFDEVWAGPENLPTIDEIRNPDVWISRMGAPVSGPGTG